MVHYQYFSGLISCTDVDMITLLSSASVSTDHNEGSVPDAEEDASVPEGAQQGVCVLVCVCMCVRAHLDV